MAALTTIFAGISAAAAVGSLGASLLAPTPKAPALPAPQVPAVAASKRTDTGATVVLGSDEIKSQRVSGRRATGGGTATGDVLGGLGAGSGLSI